MSFRPHTYTRSSPYSTITSSISQDFIPGSPQCEQGMEPKASKQREMSEFDWDFCLSESESEKHTKDEHKNCFDQAIPASKLENLTHRPKAIQCQPSAAPDNPVTKSLVRPVIVFPDRSAAIRCEEMLERMGFARRASDLPKSFLKVQLLQYSSS